MGLDMYLERCDRKAWGYKDLDIDAVKENSPALYEEIKPFVTVRGKYCKWESIFEEVGYWRKANAIHRWFVENVQDCVDDCGRYEVSKEQLEDLLSVCKLVKEKSNLKEGMITNGYIFENGVKKPILVQGKYIENSVVADEYLPTTSGFFFGGTDYDEYYMQDIDETIEILTTALKETDFDRQLITYSSSW
jgi:hypothetical protein